MSSPATRFAAGRGRADITVWERGHLMLGWADPRNVARAAGAPLEARAVAIHDRETGVRFVFVSVELAIVTDTLRDAVVQRLAEQRALPSSALMLAATHNHSGPGGFAGYVWYDIPSGGFSRAICDALAERIAQAAEAALDDLQPATLRFVRGDSSIREVAINRAVLAYNRNEDVTPATKATAALAVDPEMQLLRVDGVDGRPLAMINWLGLHGTCFHGDGTVVQPDHKGLAATEFERAMPPGFVAIFAQGSCGDVTSNGRYDPIRGVDVGPGRDDAESCARVADVEVKSARALFARAAEVAPEDAPLATTLRRERLVGRAIAPRYVSGRRDVRSGAPTIALGMALGTDEGPGPLHRARPIQRALASAARARARLRDRLRGAQWDDVQIPLVVFGPARSGRLFGRIPVTIPRIPERLAAALGDTVARVCNGDAATTRLIPYEVDVQIVRIGRWAIAGVGAEPTTVAGRRLRASLQATLAPLGVEEVVIGSYANGYVGYLVTPEEHLEQSYESGATVFGRLALPLWQTVLDEVAAGLR